MSQRAVLYINGLGSGRIRWNHRLILATLRRKGVTAEHAQVNWYDDQSFAQVLARTTQQAEKLLSQSGKLVIVGSSAGGSMALNIFDRLKRSDVIAINLCGIVQPVELPWWDHRTLKKLAHLNAAKKSLSFYGSVLHCAQEAIPALTDEEKSRIRTVRQIADFVVPRKTMSIDGVAERFVPVTGHGLGGLVGGLQLPSIIREIESR